MSKTTAKDRTVRRIAIDTAAQEILDSIEWVEIPAGNFLMGSDAEDISLTVHPHPTVGETIGLASEVFDGTITDLYIPKKK